MSIDALVIRRAVPGDRDALRLLAALDSARALRGEVLVAEAGGEIRAAYSMDEDRAVADPFRPSAAYVTMLQTRAALLREPRLVRGPRSSRVRALPARS